MKRQYQTYLCHGILSWSVNDIMQWSFPADIINTHEFQKRCIDKTHTHSVPNVHSCKVRYYRQSTPETIGCGEKVQHCCYTYNFKFHVEFIHCLAKSKRKVNENQRIKTEFQQKSSNCAKHATACVIKHFENFNVRMLRNVNIVQMMIP